VLPFRESWIPIQHNIDWAEAYLRTKWHLDPFSRLSTMHGPKIPGLPCRFFWGGGELVLHLTRCRLGRGLPPYTKWHGDRLTTVIQT